jgi:hypothetical protein
VPYDASGLLQTIEDHALARVAAAGDLMVEKKQATAPIGQTGELHDSIAVTGTSGGGGTASVTIACPVEYASYTDEGTEPHDIFGNPLLVFTGRDGTLVFTHHVDWVPDGGVEQNRGWWSTTMETDWTDALTEAGGAF